MKVVRRGVTRTDVLLFLAIAAVGLSLTVAAFVPRTGSLDARARAIEAQLRCPTCQGLSIADSPATSAEQMRELVREQLASGATDDGVRAFFAARYGRWILLDPPAAGVDLALWLVPALVVAVGAVLVVRRARVPAPATATAGAWGRPSMAGGRLPGLLIAGGMALALAVPIAAAVGPRLAAQRRRPVFGDECNRRGKRDPGFKGVGKLSEMGTRLGRATRPDLVVAIGGDGRDRHRLERLIAATGAPARLLGRVPHAELSSLYGCGDVFAMLCRNRWHGLEQEGFGIVFLEAAAAGAPQVAGDSGGAAEAVVDGTTGVVVSEPHDPRAVAGALARLLDDPSARARMRLAGRKRAVESFAYPVLADRLAAALAAWDGRGDA